MGLGSASRLYCSVCGTQHLGQEACPGELRATGAERPGWRVNVETPLGHQAIGVLLAPSDDRWRARIVTYPNVLWTVPGGRGTLKFVGDTREEAEAQAIQFVEQHVSAKRPPRRDGRAPAGADVPSNPAARGAAPVFAAVKRKRRCLAVRFGADRAIRRGVTVNLSTDGMFVAVSNPEECGRFLVIHVDLDGHTLALRGVVMWSRCRAEPDRPVGMGIRLLDPPPLYGSFLDELP